MALNPWSHEGWNLTAQAAYLLAKGEARAHARAHDAGTSLGGPRPNPTGQPPKAEHTIQYVVHHVSQ